MAIFHIENGCMPINRFTISASVLFVVTGVGAQGINKHVSWWPSYTLRYSVNAKWTLNTDVQVRNFASEPVIGLIAVRQGAHYRFSEQWTVGGGIAWFHQEQLREPGKTKASDELRSWEDLRHETKLKNWLLINQFRTEQRHWIGQEDITYRFRYRLATEHMFNGRWKTIAGNEIMWQTSKSGNNWDQYRAWIGGEYAINLKNQLQLLLMGWRQINLNVWQPAVRLNFIQSINGYL